MQTQSKILGLAILGMVVFNAINPNLAIPFAIIFGASIIGDAIKENKER